MSRQVINAKYMDYSTFVIPEGIDLENKEQVQDWWIRYDRLYIEMKDGRSITVQPYYEASTEFNKTPDHTEIADEEVDEDYKDEDYVDIQTH